MSNFIQTCRRCGRRYWFGIIGTRLIYPPHVCPVYEHFAVLDGDE